MKNVFSFITLGCRLNQAEEESLCRQFMEQGFLISEPKSADFLVVNSCSVTAVADRKTRQAIIRAKRENSSLKIIVIGCGAETAGELPEVDFWIPNGDKSKAFDLINSKFEILNSKQSEIQNSSSKRTRALLKIQDGCNNFCAYCIVPYLRGREVSTRAKEVVVEAKKLEKAGYKELVLSGVNVGKYDSNGLNLTGLIKELLKETNFPRIRLSSINPQDVTDELIDLWVGEQRLCRHFHLSLQSGCTSVLRRMGRPYTAEDYKKLSNKVVQKIPQMAITTDVIVGFPGETGGEFAETVRFVQEANLAKLHVFRYSKRVGTRAEKMENQIQDSIKTNRSEELIGVGKKLEQDFRNRFLGQEVEVLFEEKKFIRQIDGGEFWYGLTSNYIRVKYPSKENLENQFKTIKLSKENLA